MISGKYLGEIARQALQSLVESGKLLGGKSTENFVTNLKHLKQNLYLQLKKGKSRTYQVSTKYIVKMRGAYT